MNLTKKISYTNFSVLQDGLGDYSFLPFTGFLLIFFVFTLKFVPETKNKTIEEITSQWRKGAPDRKGALYEQNVSATNEAFCSKM